MTLTVTMQLLQVKGEISSNICSFDKVTRRRISCIYTGKLLFKIGSGWAYNHRLRLFVTSRMSTLSIVITVFADQVIGSDGSVSNYFSCVGQGRRYHPFHRFIRQMAYPEFIENIEFANDEVNLPDAEI
jgi:hypothetical protein